MYVKNELLYSNFECVEQIVLKAIPIFMQYSFWNKLFLLRLENNYFNHIFILLLIYGRRQIIFGGYT